MIEKRIDKLEEKIEDMQEDVVDSKQALNNISKDIHIMSQTSIEMKNAVTKLLETEVKFQLHAQEVRQAQADHAQLIKSLFKRVEAVELVTKTVEADHSVVARLSSIFWKALGWVSAGFALVVALVILFVAKAGGIG